MGYVLIITVLSFLVYIIIKRMNKNSNYLIAQKIINLIGSDKRESETIIEFAMRKNKYEKFKNLIYIIQ
jgi:D-alanyl-D-alanine carboxypeptidase